MLSQAKATDFSRFCNEFLEKKKTEVSANTYIYYSIILNNYSIPFFSNDFELTADMLLKYKDMLIEKGIKNCTINAHFRILKIILPVANPLCSAVFYEVKDDILMPKECKTQNKIKKRETDRLEQYLLSDVDSIKLGVYIRYKLKLTTGMLCALKWSDINLEKRKIYISKVVVRDSNAFSDNPDAPKTVLALRDYIYHGGRKIVNIPKKIAEILKESEPENKDVFLLTNTSHFIEPRCYINHEKRYFDECHIKKP